jgi:hypothetical protein
MRRFTGNPATDRSNSVVSPSRLELIMPCIYQRHESTRTRSPNHHTTTQTRALQAPQRHPQPRSRPRRPSVPRSSTSSPPPPSCSRPPQRAARDSSSRRPAAPSSVSPMSPVSSISDHGIKKNHEPERASPPPSSSYAPSTSTTTPHQPRPNSATP